MDSIWKFTLAITDLQEVEMPGGAEVISVATQRNHAGEEILCIWAIVDPMAVRVKRKFVVIGTGANIGPQLDLKFIGTALMLGGKLVWHVFEVVAEGGVPRET